MLSESATDTLKLSQQIEVHLQFVGSATPKYLVVRGR